MAGTDGIITLNDISELRTEINTELITQPVATESVINQFVWRRTAGGKVGETIKFVRRLWANQRRKRNMYEEIPGRKPLVGSYEVTHYEYAPDKETIPRWTNITDLYDILKDDLFPEMLARLEDDYQNDIAELIGNGTTAITVFDKVPYFVDTETHLAAPGRSNSPKYRNWLRTNQLDSNGMKKAKQLLETQPAADGNYRSMPGEVLCLCSTADQFDRADLLYRGQNVGVPVGAAAATQSNMLAGYARPVWFKHLSRYFAGASGETGDGWLLVKCYGKFAPFTLSFADQGQPQIYIEGLSLNDHSMVDRKLKHVGWIGGWGAGYLMPDLVVLNTETV